MGGVTHETGPLIRHRHLLERDQLQCRLADDSPSRLTSSSCSVPGCSPVPVSSPLSAGSTQQEGPACPWGCRSCVPRDPTGFARSAGDADEILLLPPPRAGCGPRTAEICRAGIVRRDDPAISALAGPRSNSAGASVYRHDGVPGVHSGVLISVERHCESRLAAAAFQRTRYTSRPGEPEVTVGSVATKPRSDVVGPEQVAGSAGHPVTSTLFRVRSMALKCAEFRQSDTRPGVRLLWHVTQNNTKCALAVY